MIRRGTVLPPVIGPLLIAGAIASLLVAGRPGPDRGIPFSTPPGASGNANSDRVDANPVREPVRGEKPVTGIGAAPLHVVYLLDISASMRYGNRLGRASEALLKALAELKPGDTFNLILFGPEVELMSEEMVPATAEKIRVARDLVHRNEARAGSNLLAALTAAFSLKKVTHVVLLSDGEANRGTIDREQIRVLCKSRNQQKAQIFTFGLGPDDQGPGVPLLKQLTEDSGGQFRSVNLAKR